MSTIPSGLVTYELLPTSCSFSVGVSIYSNMRVAGDLSFLTELDIRGLQIQSAFAVHYDSNNLLITSGGYTTSPTYYEPVSAYSESDGVTLYSLAYGYLYATAGALLSRGNTLVYLVQEVNPFIVADEATAESYADTGVTDKIIVDPVNKTLTVNVSVTDQKLYDYMQWWQAQPANAQYLNLGEIYKTIDGVSFLLDNAWTRISTGGAIYVAISPFDKTGNPVSGVSGRDYKATFDTLALAAADPTYGVRDLVTGNIEQHYHIFKDGSPYITSTEININWTVGSSSTNKCYIANAPEEYHKGFVADAVRLYDDQTPSYDSVLDINGFIEVSGLFIDSKGLAGGNYAALLARNNTLVEKCFARGVNGTGIISGSSNYSEKGTVKNCVAFGGSRGFRVQGYQAVKYYNNLAIDNIIGFECLSSLRRTLMYNNVALNNTTDWSVSTMDSLTYFDYSASSDGTAFTNSGNNFKLLNLVPTNEIKDVVYPYNIHLTGSALLRGSGMNLLNSNVLEDIDGEVRVQNENSIGVDYPLSFNVPVTVTVLDARTSLPVVGCSILHKADVGGATPSGTIFASDYTDIDGKNTYQYLYSGTDQPIIGRVRKGTTAPFYKTGIISGTITKLGLNITVYVTEET